MARAREKLENLAESLDVHPERFDKFLELLRKEGFLVEKQGIWYTTEKGQGMLEFCEKCHEILRGIREGWETR